MCVTKTFLSTQTMLEVGQAKSPRINNIKVRFNVTECALKILESGIESVCSESASLFTKVGKKQRPIFSRSHNFVVFRDVFIYTIFPNSGTVNATGISCYKDISKAVVLFCRKFGLRRKCHLSRAFSFSDFLQRRHQRKRFIVDNITATGTFGKSIDLRLLKKEINTPTDGGVSRLTASYNISHFPACFCRSHCYGTIIVFSTGKYNIVGSKCRTDVKTAYQIMLASINKL
jgi:TATA-box binding protein (TBP) (component of TFIID and TFIIIB)